ncbi:hypothetical protein AHMF7605_12875 [Adhaeribacter arboris]|uniref:Uncharacterized protein n=1 Tax=Adhaeribacter arboris TaxID=2072846 RepID=A0A2T2YFS2_9BACT|nr:hypothetical protein [Adhaeribacter arboris]PSR54342.1 hypothetical protein AHMF7605_12875 [Adhaeribacter arboris]
MEASALFARFEENLNKILSILQANKVDMSRTPFETVIPLEVTRLCEILNTAGAHFSVTGEGLQTLSNFRDQYMQHNQSASDAMAKILNDKRSYLKTPEGTILTKELLIRRLEYFNEVARTLTIMITQQQLGSPLQYKYPHLLQ